MTESVADRVLYSSYTQTEAMSIAHAQSVSMAGVHARLIRRLEQVTALDRELEHLPSDETIAARRTQRRGLTAPELATIMAHSKIHLFEVLLESDLPEDPYLAHDLERYFPAPLPARFGRQMRGHRLRREIIATVVANQLVDRLGSTFVFRLAEETGAATPLLARAYTVAREVFEMRSFWTAVESLDNRIEAGTQTAILMEGRRLVERSTRWLVRAHPQTIDIEATSRRFGLGARGLAAALPDTLRGQDREAFDGRLAELGEAGVPGALARRVASMQALLSMFDIVEESAVTQRSQLDVTAAYFGIGSELGLDWLRDRILELPRSDRWQALARAALRDDLYRLHRLLTREVLTAGGPQTTGRDAIPAWKQRNEAAVARALGVLEDVRASRTYDTTTLPVALRECRNLIGDATQLT
jgi:glutamate dehydrogenase